MIETFYQLKDSGQLDESSLFQVIKLYLSKNLVNVALIELLDGIYSEHTRAINGANLVDMIEAYEGGTLINGDKVLLVAHSQGNLFGNEVYDNLLPEYQGKFNMVSVGTPANSVLDGIEPYTTLTCDIVINSIIGHLESKMPCSGVEEITGHEFVPSYLANEDSLNEIAENIKKYLEFCPNPSLFEVIEHQNENTADWRVTVKNKETGEITEGVYPFNLNGSLYQLERGEWVLASCGGTEILDENSPEWTDKNENELYKLKGTTPAEYIFTKPISYIYTVTKVTCNVTEWLVLYGDFEGGEVIEKIPLYYVGDIDGREYKEHFSQDIPPYDTGYYYGEWLNILESLSKEALSSMSRYNEIPENAILVGSTVYRKGVNYTNGLGYTFDGVCDAATDYVLSTAESPDNVYIWDYYTEYSVKIYVIY